MESQIVNNSDVKNLQTLSMILDTYLENCIQNTDWDNKANAQREKEKLYQKILKTINQIFYRIGVATTALAQQVFQPLQNQQDKHLNDADNQKVFTQNQQQDQASINMNGNMEGLNDNNKADQFYGNSQVQKHQDGQQEKTNMIQLNKNQMEEESGYCQKVIINAHPFKQRLINQQQRAMEQSKQKQQETDEEDYDPPDNSSDSDFRSSDEEYQEKKKKLIHKKKHSNYFSYYSQNQTNAPRPRGRPPNITNSETGAASIFVAPASEQKRVLDFFNKHYEPQKRNKINIVNQITKQFNYSYSSVYQLVTKQAVQDDQEYHEIKQKPKPPQQRPSGQFQNQLQRQQMQQQQYYQNQFNQYEYKKDQYNGYSRYGQSQQSQLHQSDMQKRNPSYYDQQRQSLNKEDKQLANDRFAQNLLNQQSSQSYNQQYQRRNSENQYPQQQTKYQNNNNYQTYEMSQTDSDSGLFQNKNNRQMHSQPEDEFFKNDHKTQSQLESRRITDQGPEQQQIQNSTNQNRNGSSENRQNIFTDFHRSVSRDTIQIQQKQE